MLSLRASPLRMIRDTTAERLSPIPSRSGGAVIFIENANIALLPRCCRRVCFNEQPLPFQGDSLQNPVAFPRWFAASVSPPATRAAAELLDAGGGHVCRAVSVSRQPLSQAAQPAPLGARPLGATPALQPAVVCRRFYLGSLVVQRETWGMVRVSAEKSPGSGSSALKARGWFESLPFKG